MTKNNLIITVVIAVIVGGLGFFGGMQYQKNQKKTSSQIMNPSFSGGNNQQGRLNRQGNGIGMRPVSGEIVSMDENTMTIKLSDGSSKIIIYSNSTKVNRTQEGAISDLKVGEKITTIGAEGAEGTVTAESISVGGLMFQGGPQGDQLNPN